MMSLRWEEIEKTLTCIEPTTNHGREFWKIPMDPDLRKGGCVR